ncbi:ribosomal protein S18-alanine N-acetyltransferase [Massilia sp. TSP1-1-2]|uniref:ribosomal protein S18-alanine N-acetyltransferase n=1 Tax=Massilia sp. TSP1-1-2 TaxID=2804649 RepID=UPI003CF6CE2D
MSMLRDPDQLVYAPMVVGDVDEVFALETSVYPHPWSRGNFIDSLASGYNSWTLREDAGLLVGYFLLMPIVDEAHLLNVAVAKPRQREGLGLYLLDKVCACARGLSMASILLEVRPSNLRALKVYEQYGFTEIGRRKAYYPAHNGQREDAIVMRFTL